MQAEEVLNMAFAMRLAWAEAGDYARAMRRLERLAQPADETAAVVVPANEAARETFERWGIPTIDADESAEVY